MFLDIFMDDIRNLPDSYKEENGCGSCWIIQRRVDDVVGLLKRGLVRDMSLDHDMGIGQDTGYDLLDWMERFDIWPKGRIDIHSANPVGAQRMNQVLQRAREQGKIL